MTVSKLGIPANARQLMRPVCTCVECGEQFDASVPSVGKRGSSRKFCSLACRHRNYRKKYRPKKVCVQCQQVFVAVHHATKFCGDACRLAANPPEMIPCAKCGTEFRRRADRHGYNKYCSRACYFGSPHAKQVAKESRKLSKRKRMAIVDRDKWRCRDCGCRVRDDVDDRHPRKANVDHVIPLSLGGTNEDHNLQCLCRSCNARKRDRKVVLF